MNKEFVSYTQALVLRELGFDEPCIYYVDKHNNDFIYNFENHPNDFIEWCGGNVVKTPLYQQAFRWFRDKHNLLHELNSAQKDSWLITIWETSSTTKHGVYNGKRWDCDDLDENIPHTYEEAELACLNKLIEICKTK